MSHPLEIKICGITRLEDAVLAAELGATAVGFIFFADSPRAISVEGARAIAEGLEARVERIGVFNDAPVETILNVSARVGLTGVQLHGSEDARLVRRLRIERPDLRILKTIEVSAGVAIDVARLTPCDAFLLDSPRSGPKRLPLDLEAAALLHLGAPFFIAGGLRPETVGQAVSFVRPCGVDVASGVESRPGIKDRARLEAFFDALKASPPTAPQKGDR